MLGRILGGIATSLLFSAFESWLVAEHNKVTKIVSLFCIGNRIKIAPVPVIVTGVIRLGQLR